MKKIWKRVCSLLLLISCMSGVQALAEEDIPKELEHLYARGAVLMDGGSGRILFGKNENEVLPMASTTKIMTCILALENGGENVVAKVSANAAAQPEVKLGVRQGEEYAVRDLLYSLMLESHNDSAVVIAECIGGSVEQFATMMNEKAVQIGCVNTHYVTPNGLDERDAGGEHSTTAAELAKVMSYCVGASPMRDKFLEITQTRSYQFEDQSGRRSFSCQNHNAFLDMMDGVISGKTGFTSAAGYCYVCALEDGGRRFIVALLACGWPYNRTYKWSDTKLLMEYGLENYENRAPEYVQDLEPLPVKGGLSQSKNPWEDAWAPLAVEPPARHNYLLAKNEHIVSRVVIKKELLAPAEKGAVVGKVSYYLEDKLLEEYPVTVAQEVQRRYLEHWFSWMWRNYML
ncbi:MAG: D-alanyl-D-alanine carboxypeptidase family protein [Eubacteriales bacterium]|nr:D-alanyl-D-alanine carboxypeptidase family protein [Eubacteriales bacterium]